MKPTDLSAISHAVNNGENILPSLSRASREGEGGSACGRNVRKGKRCLARRVEGLSGIQVNEKEVTKEESLRGE